MFLKRALRNKKRTVATPNRSGARGFTLIEVLMSLAIFVIVLSGIIAMETKSFEAQASARYLRQAERLAQKAMAEARATGFGDLVGRSAKGVAGGLPHDDVIGLFPSGISDAELAGASERDLSKPDFFLVGRRVDQVMMPNSISAGSNASLVDAVTIVVYVLWIDVSNPAFPPPATAKVEDLELGNIIAGNSKFSPWVQGVQLRTVRLNDS